MIKLTFICYEVDQKIMDREEYNAAPGSAGASGCMHHVIVKGIERGRIASDVIESKPIKRVSK